MAVALVLLCCAGCGDSRRPLAGAVILDGQPLPSGGLLLRSADRQGAAAEQTMLEVHEGRFGVERQLGVSPGRYHATIVVYDGPAPQPAPSAVREETVTDNLDRKVRGTWTGSVEVEPGGELTITISQADLRREGVASNSN